MCNRMCLPDCWEWFTDLTTTDTTHSAQSSMTVARPSGTTQVLKEILHQNRRIDMRRDIFVWKEPYRRDLIDRQCTKFHDFGQVLRYDTHVKKIYMQIWKGSYWFANRPIKETCLILSAQSPPVTVAKPSCSKHYWKETHISKKLVDVEKNVLIWKEPCKRALYTSPVKELCERTLLKSLIKEDYKWRVGLKRAL